MVTERRSRDMNTYIGTADSQGMTQKFLLETICVKP
jgi:hypothetical protein